MHSEAASTSQSLARRRHGADDNRLGDWYANLLFTQGSQLILCVSERTLLPVVVAARDGAGFPDRLRAGLRGVLTVLGVAPGAIDSELAVMEDITLGKTRSRQVLGSMNDFAFAIDHYSRQDGSLLDLALWLAETPCSPLKMGSPDRVTIEIMGRSSSTLSYRVS